MCEIFPEFENCCAFLSLRVGLIFICVLSLISGAMGLSVLEQNTTASFQNLQHVGNIRDTKQVESNIKSLVQSGLTFMCTMFMLMGLIGLIANFMDNEGILQIFVWGSFVNVIFGFFVLLSIGYECVVSSKCILSNMDWLSGSLLMIVLFVYLIVWFYFISIANSYVLNGA